MKIKPYIKWVGVAIALLAVVVYLMLIKRKPATMVSSGTTDIEDTLWGKLDEIEKEIHGASDSDIVTGAGAGDVAGDTVDESRPGRDAGIRSVLSRLGRKGRDLGDPND